MTETFTTRTGRVFHRLPATAWLCREDGTVVVVGDPRSVEPEGCSEDEGHNCDAAGCGQDHVLATGKVVGVPLPAAEPIRESLGRHDRVAAKMKP